MIRPRTSPRPAGESGKPPLIAHVIFHLGVGGLENGLINLINHMPADRYRHAVVCIRGYSDFRQRLRRRDVEVVSLEKREGLDPRAYARAYSIFRRMRPDVVHTRNLAALEMQVPAALAGVPARIHSEHGRDGRDISGDYRPYNRIRRGLRPLLHHYVAMSRDLESWLENTIGVPRERLRHVYNGVDIRKFSGDRERAHDLFPRGFLVDSAMVVGAVGRMVPIKDHLTLLEAFAELVSRRGRERFRLVIVGDGPCRQQLIDWLEHRSLSELVWLPGERDDVPRLLRSFDVLCLTSLNEGINNTILEAMASRLPVVASGVGGNVELVEPEVTGRLFPPRDVRALADAIEAYADSPMTAHAHGSQGRRRVEQEFSIEAMVARYLALYDDAVSVPARASERCA